MEIGKELRTSIHAVKYIYQKLQARNSLEASFLFYKAE